MSDVKTEAKTATVRLHIENHYELYDSVTTSREATVPLPVPEEGTEERNDWEYEHIYPETGAGRSDGDSWYDVKIVESTVPELVGLEFEFGY